MELTLLPVLPDRGSLPSLVQELLREQNSLTAVEQFANSVGDHSRPAQAKYYQALLPAQPPGPGEQYAFEVDLDRCSGCKACVTACHALNGLDEHETWRDVGLLIGGTTALPVIQHVTAACHHCLEPACMDVCPTRAYEKDAQTGIVKHLDDQCFGCQYCILACPYDVPKYHAGKGIVRKCDMCSDRLSAGEAPACVQACPHEAIRISVVSQADVAADCEATDFLPGAPDPQITLPTTTYKTSRVFPRNMLPADYHAVRVEEAHFPLILMLVLTQLSVGACFVNEWMFSGETTPVLTSIRGWQMLTAVGFGFLALGASTLHLGRPHLAYRALLGLRTSWLSREIVAFGLFAPAAAACSLGTMFQSATGFAGVAVWLFVRAAVLVTGLAGVLCSVMIYYRTRRPTWGGTRTLWRFVGTSVWLGLSATLFAAMLATSVQSRLEFGTVMRELVALLGRPLMICAAVKLAYEGADLLHLLDRHQSPLKRLALLMTRDLGGIAIARFALGTLGGIILPWSLLAADHDTPVQWMATVTVMFVMSVAGELLERTLFFMTAVSPRMPGAVRT
ncbi:MAG: dimethyl sulfoxide reductase anchor subunit [Planctomycetes bacterium]|nr:dimethyl sulfoxide reductase anchor subunit [Planctomycetota bacterium]